METRPAILQTLTLRKIKTMDSDRNKKKLAEIKEHAISVISVNWIDKIIHNTPSVEKFCCPTILRKINR